MDLTFLINYISQFLLLPHDMFDFFVLISHHEKHRNFLSKHVLYSGAAGKVQYPGLRCIHKHIPTGLNAAANLE